ncbi:hypothetical protein L3Q67_12415 [Saccharothrix sp. AJ9571]|nr:hypothetical protein L3Q67_12415 [Saccharothrix sp. AJ9571]
MSSPASAGSPPLTRVRDTDPAVLISADGLTVRVQLLNRTGYPPWPTEPRALAQRYSDAPAATLTVPTIESFAAWKPPPGSIAPRCGTCTTSGCSSALTRSNREAAVLFRKFGPTNKPPHASAFARAPDENHWQRELPAKPA